jgi:UDP-GlcNAc:undecaprenyl-phosphate/decaprenyl-phosphate GlcNAc-1-phosphate transferase
MGIILILILACVLSLLFHPAAIYLSHFLNAFDDPHRDKIHKNPTPVLGGVAICCSVLVAVIVAVSLGYCHWSRIASGFLVGGGLIALVGFIDDRYGMSATIKMGGQILASGLFVVFANVQIGIFHPLIEFGASIFFLVMMMNAFNILDNMDAVTGSMSFAVGLSFLAIFVLSGDPNTPILAAAMVGAIIGFLCYNMPRAKIFMGDTGSMFLGFVFGAMAIIYLSSNRSFYLLTTPFLILSYPIFDITLVSFARLREMRSLSVAAPDSSPYRLVRWVFKTKNAFIVILLINLVLGGLGVVSFILKGSQFSVLLIFLSGLSLSVLGVHLYRNFLYFFERTAFFLIDLFSINLAFYSIYSLKYSSGVLHYDVYISFTEMFPAALWISVFWVLLFSVMGLYEIRPDRRFSSYLVALVKIVSLGLCGYIILNIFYEGSIVVSIVPILLYLILLVTIDGIFKYLAFWVVRLFHIRGNYKPRAILYVKDEKADINNLIFTAQERYILEGYINGQKLKAVNLPYLGELDSLAELVKNLRIEKIILVWPEKDFEEFSDIFRAPMFLETQFVTIGNVPAPFKGLKTERLFYRDYYRISMELLRTWEWAVKRAFDLALSATLLIITSPYFILKYAISKIKGEPLFEDITFYGRDLTERNAKVFASTSAEPVDFRYGLGLPALIAVFNGHLSFVGIVPLTPAQFQKDKVMIPGFWRRRFIKPGLTGPGHFATAENYFEKELQYMENMSILIDIWWLAVGIVKMFTGRKKTYA